MRGSQKLVTAVAIVLMLVVAGGVGSLIVSNECKRERQAPPAAAAPTVEKMKLETFDAATLVAEYEANEIRADAATKNKWLIARGRITEVGKDIFGSPFIVLAGAPDGLRQVQCVFPKSRESELLPLAKGQLVRVRGMGNGLMVNVMLDDCSIESP